MSSPPPPPKVKMSACDFAPQKKKQREEMELFMSMQASPMSTTSVLGEVNTLEKDLAAPDVSERTIISPLVHIEDEECQVRATLDRTTNPSTEDLSTESLSVKPILSNHVGDPVLLMHLQNLL